MSKPGGIETVKARMHRRKQAAECIVDDIMRNGQSEMAEQLALILPDGRNGGGWSRDALVGRIAALLSQLGID